MAAAHFTQRYQPFFASFPRVGHRSASMNPQQWLPWQRLLVRAAQLYALRKKRRLLSLQLPLQALLAQPELPFLFSVLLTSNNYYYYHNDIQRHKQPLLNFHKFQSIKKLKACSKSTSNLKVIIATTTKNKYSCFKQIKRYQPSYLRTNRLFDV